MHSLKNSFLVGDIPSFCGSIAKKPKPFSSIASLIKRCDRMGKEAFEAFESFSKTASTPLTIKPFQRIYHRLLKPADDTHSVLELLFGKGPNSALSRLIKKNGMIAKDDPDLASLLNRAKQTREILIENMKSIVSVSDNIKDHFSCFCNMEMKKGSGYFKIDCEMKLWGVPFTFLTDEGFTEKSNKNLRFVSLKPNRPLCTTNCAPVSMLNKVESIKKENSYILQEDLCWKNQKKCTKVTYGDFTEKIFYLLKEMVVKDEQEGTNHEVESHHEINEKDCSCSSEGFHRLSKTEIETLFKAHEIIADFNYYGTPESPEFETVFEDIKNVLSLFLYDTQPILIRKRTEKILLILQFLYLYQYLSFSWLKNVNLAISKMVDLSAKHSTELFLNATPLEAVDLDVWKNRTVAFDAVESFFPQYLFPEYYSKRGKQNLSSLFGKIPKNSVSKIPHEV